MHTCGTYSDFKDKTLFAYKIHEKRLSHELKNTAGALE